MRILSQLLIVAVFLSKQLPAQWIEVAPMSVTRAGHVSALMNDGRLLVAGGWDYTSNLTSAEIYNPDTDSWSDAGNMSSEHYTAQAVTLQDGKVLVISGFTGAFNTETCDLFDPQTATWSSGGFLAYGRSSFTATLLQDGRVLVAGGFNGSENLKYCEIYDPASNSWSLTDSLETGRSYHTGSLLPDGRVLVVGGFNPDAGFQLASAELFDPQTNTWSEAASLTIGRDYHAASVLYNGKVMVTGGRNFNGSNNFAYNGLSEVEVYDPASDSWVFDEFLPSGLSYHRQVTIGTGSVLVIAGVDSSNFSTQGGFTTTAGVSYLYDTETGEWSDAGMNQDSRYEMTADVLESGEAIVTGGVNASVEIFDIPLSLNSLSAFSGIEVFPNPASSFVHVKIKQSIEIVSWNLSDLSGRSIESEIISSAGGLHTIHAKHGFIGMAIIRAVSAEGQTFIAPVLFNNQ
jgi:N-acetylneuraminic acid mutarotase